MTAEERFDCMWRREFTGNLLANPRFKEKMIVWLGAARQDGIEEEREACAKIANDAADRVQSQNRFGDGMRSIADCIANSIRARSEGKGSE